MADKALILQAVKTYKHDKSFYFKAPQDLKPKQIPGAIKKWAKTVPERDVVALMDTTLFDSGKEGFLVTEKDSGSLNGDAPDFFFDHYNHLPYIITQVAPKRKMKCY